MNPLFQTLQGHWHTFWRARAPREQLILMLGSAALLVGLYLLAVGALQQRIGSLQKQAPELLLNSYEIASGGQANTAPVRGSDLRSDLYKILAERNVEAELRALSPQQVEMRLPDQTAGALLGSLHTLRQAVGARVVSLQIRAEDADGIAGATVILERK